MTRQHILIVSGAALGMLGLAGCGVSRHLAATPPNNGRTTTISGTIHSSGGTTAPAPSPSASATPSPTLSSTPTTGLTSAGQVEAALSHFLKATIASPSLPPIPSVPGPGGGGKLTIY